MIFEIENNSILITVLLATCCLSLLWPLLIKAKSKIHLLGMIVNNFISLGIMLLIAKIYLKGLDIETTIISFGGLSLFIKVSALGVILGLLLTILWPFAYAYSWGYLCMTSDQKMEKFLFFVNLSLTAAILASLAGNLITMFVAYELLTLATLPLVAHDYTTHVNKSLKKYIFYLVGSSICLFLPAILLIDKFVGNSAFTIGGIDWKSVDHFWIIIIFSLCLFGIAKVAIFPLHRWLPAAMVANYPVSAILHAVAVVKVGIYCLLKIITEIFGINLLHESFANFPYLKYLAAFSTVFASLKAVRQHNIKRLLAYSTITHLNIMIMAALILSTSSIYAATIHMLVHSFAKITLFFAFGYIYLQTGASNLEDLGGSIKKFPLVSLAIFVAAMILAGFPVFASSFSKKVIILEAVKGEEIIIFSSLVLASILSAIYSGKIMVALGAEDTNQLKTINRNFIVKWVTYAVAGLALSSYWLINNLMPLIEKIL